MHSSLIRLFVYCACAFCLSLPMPFACKAQGQEDATQQSPRAQTTVLSGKVVSPVVRAKALPFNAIVEKIFIAPGQEVIKNQVLMTYSLTEEAERALQKEITIEASTENIRGQMLTLESQLADVKAERNKARQLAASGLGSSQAFQRIEGDVKSLQARIALLQQTIDKKESVFQERLEELSGYFGTRISAGVDLPKTLLLTSPMDGHVLSMDASLYPGALLKTGSTPILVGLMNPMLIQVQVYESEVGRLQLGATTTVTIPSLESDKSQQNTFIGTVSEIAWTSNSMIVDAPSYFTVELTVPNPDMRLKPGFKAIVTFEPAQ